MHEDRADVIAGVCGALRKGDRSGAAAIAQARYPFTPNTRSSRAYTPLESMRVFLRDGFRDRYSGQRLIFPGTLRVLSKLLPDEFPTHSNWKMSETHIAYWELFPTVDHLVPIARGGADTEENWVTTSMLRNSAKSNWTLEELGWSLFANERNDDWDGLTSWCLQFLENSPELAGDVYIGRWRRAAVRALR